MHGTNVKILQTLFQKLKLVSILACVLPEDGIFLLKHVAVLCTLYAAVGWYNKRIYRPELQGMERQLF